MRVKTFNLSLPRELVELIDSEAKRIYATRSEYIRRAIMAQLKTDGAQERTPVYHSYEEARRDHLKKAFEAKEYF